jgi:ankyrin repeat protein
LFERSFGRTLGLARLLVLEKLPNNKDREAYVDQRRAERGRPTINRWNTRSLQGNMKEEHDDEVAEWVETDEVSDYHTFTIPYGPKYGARKIERLLYAKDLLLNAEWNRPKERETALHRHPAFFGNATDVIGDCCGYCPEPVTSEDKEISEVESKTYVSGELSFIKDDPGRQAIGSFNPLTDDDWTEMAYVGNTARLCQAIVDGDLEHVQDWLNQEGADPNRRDYTGRTPLHLAVMTSTPEIVQSLIDGGARIVARLVDGRTALHHAAMRGEVEMVKALLIKSEANEELEAEKTALKRGTSKPIEGEDEKMFDIGSPIKASDGAQKSEHDKNDEDDEDGEESDVDMMDDESENADATTEGSMIKIDRKSPADNQQDMLENSNDDEPDVYNVDVLAWDIPVSALHLAIANGHVDVVKTLVQEFGADVLLPVKLMHDYSKSARAAILPIVLALQLSPEKAKAMTELLINLGASPAQADIEHVTALQYFTAQGVDLLSTMVSANRPAAQRAANHLSMSGSQYSPSGKGALHTAILNRDIAGVEALLELGAKADIDFGTFMTSYKTKWDPRGSSEDNEKDFRRSFTQPVLCAVSAELTSVVLRLLDAGADMNTLTPTAWGAIQQGSSYGDDGLHTLLDSVRHKINNMRKFVETGDDSNNQVIYGSYEQFPPIPLEDDAEYLRGHDPQSYAHLCLVMQLEDAKSNYERDLENYNNWVEPKEEPRGTAEKKAAVQLQLSKFEALENQLLERGAKTFKDLHPDVNIEEHHPYNYHSRSYEPEPPKPWTPLLSFQVPDMTDERREAYLKLFQACWDADLPTIKELTLAVWGVNQTPLKIAVQDTENFSPFSIAVLRKHFDIARAILEIAQAQYAPEEKFGQAKYSMQSRDEDEDVSNTDDDDVQIYSEIVDDRFTIENIGEVQGQVKSTVTPLTLISWGCPVWRFLEGDDTTPPSSPGRHALSEYQDQIYRFRSWGMGSSGRSPRQVIKHARNGRTYHVPSAPTQEQIPDVVRPENLFQFAIYLNDSDLLHFVIAMGEDYTARKVDAAEETTAKFYRFEESDFLYAVRLGRVELLKEIIKRTGSGIPLDDLVKKSGIVIPEKPKFYQGLSVHGQKRADWANAGREVQSQPAGVQHPPLLHAARMGCLESVEWFSSDGVLRCYSEFTDNHRDDIRIQNLAKTKGGSDAAINKWLNLRSHLLLHCVILGKTNNASLKLLKHLCKSHPQALEHRSATGMTPLQLAFRLHRVEMIKILLEAGAQQTCRDNVGNNLIHTILADCNNPDEDKLARIRELLGLIDTRLLASLFKERTTESPGAATPLARWIHSSNINYSDYDNKGNTGVLDIILAFSKGEDLSIISGEGDTPLHVATRHSASIPLRTMLECRPNLLFRENATGRTPYEIAEDNYLSKEVFNNPPSLTGTSNSNNDYGSRRRPRRHAYAQDSVVNRQANEFVDEPEDVRSGVDKVWQLCREFASKQQGIKRKLVSLVEASEVAKRLAAKKGSREDEDEGEGVEMVEKNDGDEDEDVRGDEVDVWFHMGVNADY